MAPFVPEVLDKAKLKDIQLAMRKDLRAVAKIARGKNLWFVAAADVPLADKTKSSLFVVSPKEPVVKAWQLKIKGRKPMALTTGTCTLETKDGIHVSVVLDKIKGDRKITLKAAKLAFKLDQAVQISDSLAEDDGEDESEAENDGAQAGNAAAKSETDLGSQAEKMVAALASAGDISPEEITNRFGSAKAIEELNRMLDEDKATLEAEAQELIDELMREFS